MSTPDEPAAGAGEPRQEPLTPAERDELDRLRVRSAASAGSRAERIGRWTAAVVLLVVGALLGGTAVAATYVHSQILDTDRYVETVAPLAANTDVTNALANRLTNEIMNATNIAGLVDTAANDLVKRGLPSRLTDLAGTLVTQIRSFIDGKLRQLLATPQFQTIWNNINRVAHTAVVNILLGTPGKAVTSSGNTITLDIGALLTAAKPQLAAAGLGFVNRIPNIPVSFTLVTSDQIPKIRKYAHALDVAATWLPWVALAFFVAGVLVAPGRRNGMLVGVVSLIVVDILLLIGIAVGRRLYLDSLPPTVQSPAAAAALFDIIIRFLKEALWTLLVALGVAVAALWIAGPSRPARALRRLADRAFDGLGRGLSRAGQWTGSIGRGLAAVRHPLQIVLVLLAIAGYILADHPSPASVAWLIVILLFVLAVIEVFARTSRPAAPA